MSEAHPLFAVLCKSADADCATALERLVREAPDRRLNRINVLDFARPTAPLSRGEFTLPSS